jgi:hypothetical protein
MLAIIAAAASTRTMDIAMPIKPAHFFAYNSPARQLPAASTYTALHRKEHIQHGGKIFASKSMDGNH